MNYPTVLNNALILIGAIGGTALLFHVTGTYHAYWCLLLLGLVTYPTSKK